ncbi:uncharacterized protein M6B38_107745 [Iris pallida]|uniref:Uncharacterized protein n=1 Tax=Iris pallida TaxID=29817 RepID=A0AAX6EHA5_IRIPA|nr:uncharacterized protein M6B38_107745 [Iris pallida]
MELEMFSSRRKQLMLLGMDILIYFTSRNCMELLELDNVVDEKRLLFSRQYHYFRNPYLGGKQDEMLSSRRKQLMLVGYWCFL